MRSRGGHLDAMDVAGAYVDAVHGEPQGAAAGALTLGFLALFAGEEVGADEGAVLAAQDGVVREGAVRRVAHYE
ncbi:hypothetical protein [Streptomyces sp. NPDC017988]|uniref:hypothetical protein n=1 Tax=Streptomyces sp. NPDC017988 TaxID=3365025 RepID=UPI0037B6FB30